MIQFLPTPVFVDFSLWHGLARSPDIVPEEAWDVMARGAKWARENAHILKTSRWVGGDAVQLQVTI